MIDLHAHILPGIDDGSPSLEQSLEMAVLAAESGVDTMICTPHANQMGRFENFNSPELQRYFSRFREIVEQERIPLDLYLGMEIYSSYDMGRKIKNKQLISLNHSGYYLIEFDFNEEPEEMEGFIRQVFESGGIPLLAHPERYFCVQEDPQLIYRWCKAGCLAQINKGSLFGKFGRSAYYTAEALMEHELVTCVASDAHSPYQRTTYMEDAWKYLREQYGEETAYRLTTANPERIITGRRIGFNGRSF